MSERPRLTPQPMIGIIACTQEADDGVRSFKVGEKYVRAIHAAAGAVPVMLPPLGAETDIDALLDRLDGLFLTGSPSNVEPRHYDGPAAREGVKNDPDRDATTLPLIEAVLARGLPLFCVCRGHQELNVALGGTLHQHVHELPGKRDHREPHDLPVSARYGAAHPIAIAEGGLLARINGGAEEVMVNSLHSQAIDRPADRLMVEAVADDDVIEAVSVKDAPGFALGVQWHPEHPTALEWPLSQAMFRAFGEAARDHAHRRKAARAA